MNYIIKYLNTKFKYNKKINFNVKKEYFYFLKAFLKILFAT